MLWVSKPLTTFLDPNANNNSNGIYLFFVLYIFISVYGLWAEDTYHIWEGFLSQSGYRIFNIDGYEAVYNWLATQTGDNYFLWRFIIWTPACLLIYYTAKALSLLNRNFLVSLALFGGFLAFTRGMLGHTMLIFGLTIFLRDRKTFSNQIMGITLIFMSYFFHKSMYVNLIFAILALIPFGRIGILISIPLFPIAISIASLTSDIVSSGDVYASYGEGVGGVGDKTLEYMEREKSEITTNGYIGQIISLTPLYFAFFYLYIKIYVECFFDYIKNGRLFKYLYRLSYVALYISSTYLFLDVSEWISSRFRYMAIFPLIFVLGKVWSMEHRTNIYIKMIILLQLFAVFMQKILQTLKWYEL